MSKKGLLDLDYSKIHFKDPESNIFKSERDSAAEQSRHHERKLSGMDEKVRIRSYEHFMKRACQPGAAT